MSGPGDEKRVFDADTRRRWSHEEKLRIVGETKTSPVTRVAKKYGVASGLVFRWRKALGDRASTSPSAPDGFMPVLLAASAETAPPGAKHGCMEIVLASGRRVIVGGDVDAGALKRVIEVLDGR